MLDAIIIGGGPAGVSAAINLKLLDKTFKWFGILSKKVERAELIKNYPGFCEISGERLSAEFAKHIESLNIQICREIVNAVYSTDGYFTVAVKDENYTAKTIILCLGVKSETIEGEEQFLGRGISYCATCDGFLYRDKVIAVMCTDKRLESEVEYLANISKKAYVMPLYKDFEIKSGKAEIILKKPISFGGDMRINKVNFVDGSLDVDGAFILRSAIPPSALIHGIATTDGHIAVNRDMSTSIEGVFAAGDCTGRPYQYAKAVGEGNVAAHSAVEYIARKADKRHI